MNFSAEHLALPALEPAILKDWYVVVLDAKLIFENGQTPHAYFLALPGGLMLEIYHTALALKETANNSLAGWRHLALRVDSIEQAQALLETRGVKFTDPIKTAGGGGRVLFFRDAEHNLLHLVERPADAFVR